MLEQFEQSGLILVFMHLKSDNILLTFCHAFVNVQSTAKRPGRNNHQIIIKRIVHIPIADFIF